MIVILIGVTLQVVELAIEIAWDVLVYALRLLWELAKIAWQVTRWAIVCHRLQGCLKHA